MKSFVVAVYTFCMLMKKNLNLAPYGWNIAIYQAGVKNPDQVKGQQSSVPLTTGPGICHPFLDKTSQYPSCVVINYMYIRRKEKMQNHSLNTTLCVTISYVFQLFIDIISLNIEL
jgi:hypothetical protein